MKTNEKIFIVPDFMAVLLTIKNNNLGSFLEVSHKYQVSYSHLDKIKKLLTEREWITIEKEGRRHRPVITPKGLELTESIESVLKNIDMTLQDVYDYKSREKRPEGIKSETKKIKVEEGVEFKETITSNTDKESSDVPGEVFNEAETVTPIEGESSDGDVYGPA